MKKFILIFIIILLIIFYSKSINDDVEIKVYIPIISTSTMREKIPIINNKNIKMTMYNNTIRQCDSTPNTMAWNDKITWKNRNKVAAISRDLIPILSKNTKIYYEHGDKIYDKIVLDKMGKHARKGYRNKFKIISSIDVLTQSHREARHFGRRSKKIYWYGGEIEIYNIEIRRNLIMLVGNLENILKNCKIEKISKLGYVEVKSEDGKKYFISTQPPRNPAMYADFYQFTKMAMYLECGKENEDSTFESFYRRNPYNGNFAIYMGLSEVVKYLEQLEFTGYDIDYLKSVWNFSDKFWEYLREFKWQGILRSLPEGSICSNHVPLTQISSKTPIGEFVETKILNLIGGPTSIGTKAFRMYLANPDVSWIEMAARRAQSEDVGMMISKYSYICAPSCIGTSLTMAGKEYGIPVMGTTSHSSVLAYNSQYESFSSHVDLFRDKSVFILDTFGYINGLQDAIQVAKDKGLKSFGGRIDTDELEFKTKVVREILDANGFKNAKIICSNNIDEFVRLDMKKKGAKNDFDGIGTSLVPQSLDIVYKPVKMNNRDVIKLSSPEKITDPGIKDVYRLVDDQYKIKAYILMLKNENDLSNKKSETFYNRLNNRAQEFSNLSCAENILETVLIDDEKQKRLLNINELKDAIKFESNHYLTNEMKELENKSEFPLYISNGLKNLKENLMIKMGV